MALTEGHRCASPAAQPFTAIGQRVRQPPVAPQIADWGIRFRVLRWKDAPHTAGSVGHVAGRSAAAAGRRAANAAGDQSRERMHGVDGVTSLFDQVLSDDEVY